MNPRERLTFGQIYQMTLAGSKFSRLNYTVWKDLTTGIEYHVF